ncbi:MAG: hypothetical protein GY871_15525 [Actinomycetales bacterium]|nr:hypothetical protein [Actinomycetales bacterium]
MFAGVVRGATSARATGLAWDFGYFGRLVAQSILGVAMNERKGDAMVNARPTRKLYETKRFSRVCVGLAVVLLLALVLGLILFVVMDIILMRNFT